MMVAKYPQDHIICVDVLTYAGKFRNFRTYKDTSNFTFMKADIADRQTIYEIFEQYKPDIVINFAAESHVDRSIENPEAFYVRILWGLLY